MSPKDIRWVIPCGNETSTIHFHINNVTTRRFIEVNGTIVLDRTPVSNLSARYQFDVCGKKCVLEVGRNYAVFERTYRLTVDGAVVDPSADAIC